MSHRIILPKAVQKELDRLADEIAERALSVIENLKQTPRPPGCKKLRGINAWRVRFGDYRMIYEISDQTSEIRIVTIGHRRDVYR